MPGVAFPPVGPVGLGSPPSSVLCVAKTAILPVSGRFARRALPDTWPASARSWSPLRAHARVEAPDHARAFGRPVPQSGHMVKEIGGSPTFPSSPSVCMPRSQTPVVSCPTRPIARRTAAFRRLHTVGFPLRTTLRDILLSTTLHLAGLHHAACILAHSSFVRPLRGWHVEFAPDLLARRSSGGT